MRSDESLFFSIFFLRGEGREWKGMEGNGREWKGSRVGK